MTKEALINKTLKALAELPQEKISEIADFAEYILKKYDDDILGKGMQKLVGNSNAWQFLKDEEDLYTVNDLQERYR